MLFLTNFTEPSAKTKFAPLGCRLRKPHWPRLRHGGFEIGIAQLTECGTGTLSRQSVLPFVTGGALRRGVVKAPPVIRRSPGQVGDAPQGGPTQDAPTFQKLKCDVPSSSLKRQVSPAIIVLLVPSVTLATRYAILAPKSPLLSFWPQRSALRAVGSVP